MDHVSETKKILDLEPTAILVLSIVEAAEQLSLKMNEYIINQYALANSIYMRGSWRQLTTPSKRYFTKDNLGTDNCITDIALINEDVYDESGVLVINAGIMQNKSKYLMTGANDIVTYTPIIDIAIKDVFNRKLRRYNQFNTRSAYAKVLTEQGVEVADGGAVEICCLRLLDQLLDFIGNDVWHIYYVKFIGSDVAIYKTCDVRIYEWTKTQLELNDAHE